MSHLISHIWIHAIWSTKYRLDLISVNIEDLVFSFMRQQFEAMGCSVKVINGMPDHVHCLFTLNRNKSIAEVIKQVKGSTAYYINQNNLAEDYFSWQIGYAAFSVSESLVARVSKYISEQKENHLSRSFEEEFQRMIETQRE